MKKARGVLFSSPLRRRNSTSAASALQMDSPLSSPPERYSFNPILRWNPEVEEYFSAAYGAEHFARISKALTQPSSYSCVRVNTLKSTSDAVIQKLIAILEDKRQKSNATKVEVCNDGSPLGSSIVNTIGSRELCNRQTPEESQSHYIFKCPYPGLENIVFVKGSGPHKLHYGNQPCQPMKEVIVSRKCAEAVLRGAQVYVPGVLACSAHVEKGDVVAVSVAVEQPTSDGGGGFGFTRGTVLQGSQSDPQYHERNGLYIGEGTTSLSRATMFRVSHGTAVEMTNRVYELPSFYDILEGEIFLQNLPSIVTASVLDPQEGERILDMCAAPGGKTTAIAILMRDKGEVIALDRSHNKVMDILKLAAEMDLTCIKAYKLDALKSVCRANGTINSGITDANNEELDDVTANNRSSSGFHTDDKVSIDMETCSNDASPSLTVSNGKTDEAQSNAGKRKNVFQMKNGPGRNQCTGGRAEKSKGFMPNSFDRVLLDAPCSALGLRPRLFAGEETMESLINHGKYQRRMFDQAVRLVRPGGVIVYSTCTINPGENEALVRYALDKYKCLSLVSQQPKIGGPGVIGRCDLFERKFSEEWLTESEAELVQRFDPSSSLDTIGFFIAKFVVGDKDF
ncbi:methyltransferase NSUN6 isoform X1 [Canna indica]|uniref:Methyltransferase NSUN6 isoform X1 n=1 Tax=Canna indica TaxID=4628 RepID=A0AAQ3KWY5_9LILI|nr:methyltransferase NSUN6 isoform X1 [Canna indica]